MELDSAIAELSTLVETLERDGDERALLLLQLVDAIHRPGMEKLAAGNTEDPLARALLAMYDLVPLEDRIQVEEALDEIRPYIQSHGGALELLDVDEGVVHVVMSGACHGCAGSAMTLRRGIEEKLRERYPNFKEIVAHDPEGEPVGAGSKSTLIQIEGANGFPPARPTPPAPGQPLLQIENLQAPAAKLRRPVFEDVGPIDELPPGEMRVTEVAGVSVIVLNVDGEPYAFKNGCTLDADRLVPMDGAKLSGKVLVCPWHNCAYDARTGRRADDTGDPPLNVVPIAVRDGMLKVAVNAA